MDFGWKKEIVLSHNLIEFQAILLVSLILSMGKGQIVPRICSQQWLWWPQNSIRLSSYCFVLFSNLWRDWDPPEKVQPPLSLLLLPCKLPKQNESTQTITWIVKTQILWPRPLLYPISLWYAYNQACVAIKQLKIWLSTISFFIQNPRVDWQALCKQL